MMDSTEDTHQYIVVHQATLRNRVLSNLDNDIVLDDHQTFTAHVA